MSYTRTLTFTPGPSIKREALTLTAIVGEQAGLVHASFSLTQRPLYRFSIDIGPLIKSEVECLSALHAYHQGNKSFFWDGGPYGTIDNYNLVGEGDSIRKDFFLPNRYVTAGSIAVATYSPVTQETSLWSTAYSLNPNPGLLVFATIPASGHDVMAKWACRYRVFFSPEGIKLEKVALDLYQAQLMLVEAPLM